MKRFENQTFEYFQDWAAGRVFSDMEFINCRFLRWQFSSINFDEIGKKDFVRLRSIVRRVNFTNSVVEGVGFIGPGIVEDTIIDGLRVLNHVQTIGTAFRRVVIKGAVDKLMITPHIDTFGENPQLQRAFDQANRDYYQEVDWALDISQAVFKDCDIRAIPASLIIRDPSTQFVLRREKAMQGLWRDIDLSATHWGTSIDFFLERGDPDCVLVAPKAARNFKALLDGLHRLRDMGILEP